MTNWLPDVTAGTGPIYVRLADQIETAIADGTLPAGAKLPPQRNLAFDIGVTIGTVGRAYALVHERGLVSGEVGRGTYVLPPAEANSASPADPIRISWSRSKLPDADPAILRFDTTAAPDVGQADNIGEALSAIMREHPLDVTSYTRIFPPHWFEAGARWLARCAPFSEAVARVWTIFPGAGPVQAPEHTHRFVAAMSREGRRPLRHKPCGAARGAPCAWVCGSRYV